MAKPKAPPASEQDPNDPVLKTMNRLLERARLDRNRHQSRIADCYKYAMPWRHKFYQSQHVPDLDEIFDETIATVIEDFSADMNVKP
jgi:3-methyladenine DNA glycosylase AlkC